MNQRERKEINPSHNAGEVKGCGTMHYVRGIQSPTCFTSSCVLCGTRYESIAGVYVYCTYVSMYGCNSIVSFSKSHKRASKNNWPGFSCGSIYVYHIFSGALFDLTMSVLGLLPRHTVSCKPSCCLKKIIPNSCFIGSGVLTWLNNKHPTHKRTNLNS